jgi:hypothetical protein
MNIHLFGAATATGESFRQLIANYQSTWVLYRYSRKKQSQFLDDHPIYYADFSNPSSFFPSGEDSCSQSFWISFGPIWLFTYFLESLARLHPERLSGLRGLVVCSSSSVITKRFSFNSYDRELVSKLRTAEERLIEVCLKLKISCRILRPTLVYGKVGPYEDNNLSRLLHLLDRLPCLPLPAESGMRQPIHANQLAAVAFRLVQDFVEYGWDLSLPERIELGGDTTLTYFQMIFLLQQTQSSSSSVRRCRLLPLPNRLFFALGSPLLLSSPKAFEALLRMGADLSGFTPAHKLLGSDAQPFPVLSLS